MSCIYISWEQNSNFSIFFLSLNPNPLEHESIELQNDILQKERIFQDKNERPIEW